MSRILITGIDIQCHTEIQPRQDPKVTVKNSDCDRVRVNYVKCLYSAQVKYLPIQNLSHLFKMNPATVV